MDLSNTWWRLPSSGLAYYLTKDTSLAAEVADVVKNVPLDLALRLAFRQPKEPPSPEVTTEDEVVLDGHTYLIPAPKARSITLDWEAFTVVARDKKIPCAGTFVELGRAHPHPRGALPSEHLPWLKLGERNGFTVLETPDGHYWKDCEIHAGTLVRALENTGPRGPEELGEALVGSVGITNGTQTSPVTNNAPSAQTAKAETDCRKRLVKMMRESPNKKLTSKAEIGLLFPNIGGRAFERAWRQAIDETGATAWSKAGAPRGRRKVRPQVQLKKIAAAEITAAK